MSVYYFDLIEDTTTNDGTYRLQTNPFWENTNSSLAYDILINYVIYGNDTATRGHYSFGNFFIQSNNDSARTDGYPPNHIINQVKNNQISLVDDKNNPKGQGHPSDPSGVQWIKITGGTQKAKYSMKCTVI
uniref:Uncharacterized protein n=1 Tax=viral metagenome TaxID=1070528 RepID=A0A6C0CFG3_9ZZZZ